MYYDYHRIDAAGAPMTVSAANTVTFASGAPIDVKRIIGVVTTAVTGSAKTITVGVRKVNDADSVSYATFTIPATAVNGVFDAVVAETASNPAVTGVGAINGPVPGVIYVDPGEELFITSDAAGGAGAVQFYVEYFVQGFSGVRVEQSNTRPVNRVG